MEAVRILRQLWQQRLWVAAGIGVALIIGLIVAYKITLGLPPSVESRQYQAGASSASVLVDSESSQVVDLGGGPTQPDVAQLSVRARLLANLMATSPMREQIAERAGVRPDWLIAHPPPQIGVASAQPAPRPAAIISENDRRASILRLHVNETLPIITAQVDAPTARAAARIASSAIGELNRYLQSVTAGNRVPDARRLVVTSLGAATSATVTKGRSPLLGLAVFVLLFGLWCAGIVVMSRVTSAWRADGDEPDAPSASPREPAQAKATWRQADRSSRWTSSEGPFPHISGNLDAPSDSEPEAPPGRTQGIGRSARRTAS